MLEAMGREWTRFEATSETSISGDGGSTNSSDFVGDQVLAAREHVRHPDAREDFDETSGVAQLGKGAEPQLFATGGP
jgi:hypothetical protein